MSVEEVALEDLVAALEETSDAYAFSAEGDSAFGRTDRAMAALVEESRRMKTAALESR